MKLINKKKLVLILYVFFTFISSNEENIKFLRCGEDKVEPILMSSESVVPIDKKNPNYRRILDNIDEDGFKDFNIHLDLNNFDDEVSFYGLQQNRELFVTGMTKAINTLSTLLKVKPPLNYAFTDENIKGMDINNWDHTKIGNGTQGMAENGIDLFIFVRFGDKSEMGELTLASAGARYMSPQSGQPLIGIVNINREVDYSKTNSLEYFESIIIHEFTHILGFSNYFFNKYFHNTFIKADSNGIQRAYINSTKVVETAKKYFNCEEIDGVELEEYGGEGTVGSHWEARILLGDYMNGVVFTVEQVISEFTLALLEDSGYYKANYYTGGLMQYGKNKGCEFIKNKCVNNGEIDPKFSNEFFNNIDNIFNNFDASCSSDRQSRAYHIVYSYNELPSYYQYFVNEKHGGWASADYCPVSTEDRNTEGKDIYYVGHCSERGSGEYGSHIFYQGIGYISYNSSIIKDIIGEKHSQNSFCVLSSLISKNIENYNVNFSTIRAVCYQMYCSERSLTIQINDDFVVCPRPGGSML